MTEEILNKSIICIRCYHTREFHLTDKDGHVYCKKCKCHTYVGHTTEVLSAESGQSRGEDKSFLYNPLTFSCMNCGHVHKKIACPKCGSKAVRAG